METALGLGEEGVEEFLLTCSKEKKKKENGVVINP
jgi:hypothetical protein